MPADKATPADKLPLAGPPPAIPKEPLVVYTGLYFNDFAKIDMKQHDFFADFYVWFRARLPAGETWTPSTVEFMNGIKIELTKVEEKKLHDGNNYWEFRVKGTFRGHFDLARYPMDTQRLPVILEDSTAFSKKLVFAPDPTHHTDRRKWLDELIRTPDWRLSGAVLDQSIHDYGTTFGDTTPGQSEHLSRFSRFAFRVILERESLPHFVKFLIPLLVIAGMAFVTFFIRSDFSTTSRLCGTALLSSIALHISNSRNLPEVGYLLVSDKIFILFYIAIFFTLCEKVAVNRFNATDRAAAGLRLDRAFRWLYPLWLTSGSLLIVLT